MAQVLVYEFDDKRTGTMWTSSAHPPMTEEEWISMLPDPERAPPMREIDEIDKVMASLETPCFYFNGRWLSEPEVPKELVTAVRNAINEQHYEEPMPEFNGDQLAEREERYKARKTEADAFLKGISIRARIGGGTGSIDFAYGDRDKSIFDPFYDLAGNKSFKLENCHNPKAVDPWEYYGKDFCASKYVTMALAYLDETPATEAPRPKDDGKHPLYPKSVHYRPHSFVP